jgi:hypothetical protein
MSLRGAHLPHRSLREAVYKDWTATLVAPATPAALAAVMRAQHASKIQQLRSALEAAGFQGLDEQAKALGLSRSTTWTIIAGKHKASGLSATIIKRMLQKPGLPPVVRTAVVEYVAEKAAGRYGHSKTQLRRFSARLQIEAAE